MTTTNTHTLWIEEANSFIWKIDLIYFPFIVRICVDLEKLLNVGRIVGTGNILFFIGCWTCFVLLLKLEVVLLLSNLKES